MCNQSGANQLNLRSEGCSGLTVATAALCVAILGPGAANVAKAASPGTPNARQAQPEDRTVVTRHQITVDGRKLKYAAQAGFITLRDHSRQPRARMFFVAYTLDGRTPSSRPLTFLWNGGPGSPASMVELGMAGPRRAKMPGEYATKPPPYRLVNNENTWLLFTDLVFVDPVGTGYSYPIKPDYGPEFWNAQGDVDSIAEFIRIYRERYDRTKSPLFICGESYGTVRAAGVAETLEKSRGLNFAGGFINRIPLRGVILLSGELAFSLTRHFKPESVLPYVLFLPSYAAAAAFHKKLAPDLEESLRTTYRKAEKWAMTDYAVALLQGDRLSPAEREATAQQLSRYTGLDPNFIEKHDLRVNLDQFASHLLAKQGLVLGHYDTRVTYKAPADAPYNVLADKSLFGHGIGRLIVPYLRNELRFKAGAFYAGPFAYGWPPPANPRGDWLALKWNHGTNSQGSINAAADLAKAIREYPALHVFWASGYFDPGTAFASRYVFDHMGLDSEQRSRVEMKDYPGGHMIYLSGDNRRLLERDVSAFVGNALASSDAGHH